MDALGLGEVKIVSMWEFKVLLQNYFVHKDTLTALLFLCIDISDAGRFFSCIRLQDRHLWAIIILGE